MITSAGILNQERLSAGDVAGLPLTHIIVGENNAAPTASDTVSTFTNAQTKPITSFQYLPGGLLKMTASLAAGDPAINAWEVGVLNSAGDLMFRKVFGTVKVKPAGLAVTITYTIRVQ